MTSFAAPWDQRLRVGTPLIAAVMLGAALLVQPVQPWMWGIRCAIVLAIFCAWAWAPRAFRLEGGDLVVARGIGGIRIPLSGLTAARRMRPDELRGAARVCASGGFFGYYGRFLASIESQRWFVTDREKAVRLDLPGGVVVVSPSDPDAFLARLNVPEHASR
jgi:hypothetical protein